MNIKQRVEKLEKVKKPNTFLVCWLQDAAEEDLAAETLRYCRENNLKQSDVVFLGDGDMEA
jgi:hypothetical protein